MRQENEQKSNLKIYSLSKRIVLIATMSAILIVGKFSIAIVPNIEVVTTLVIVFAYVFGYYTIGATAIFCLADIVIYPTTPDVIASYFIYWNLLAALAAFFSKSSVKSDVAYLILGLTMTVFFGFLTSYMQSKMTGVAFLPIYLSGILLYIAHFISTLVFMSAGFRPLTKALLRFNKKKYFV